jgi:hypothetical protein
MVRFPDFPKERRTDKRVVTNSVLPEGWDSFWQVHLNNPLHKVFVGDSCFAIVGESELYRVGFGHVFRALDLFRYGCEDKGEQESGGWF